ncbi:MAG: hypothetical protein HC828_12605 [Blastochloris sp.]|nr:hypothetical protein [Blastochloris sp.]
MPYRGGERLIDAKDRRAAIDQLAALRDDLLRMGTYQEGWNGSFPGSGITDTALRERVFAVLFTAMQGQYANYARLLLVIDIVLGNLLLGDDSTREAPLAALVSEFDYPDPHDPRVKTAFYAVVEKERG